MNTQQRPARVRRQHGASSVEYGLLIALIAAVIVTSVLVFGGGVSSLFTQTCESARDNGGIATTCN